MSSTEEGIWYELRPNAQPVIGSADPRRYRDREAAEQAAAQMRERYPDFRFVEIISYEMREGKRSRSTPVGRV
jgi:hypothetical protein